MGNSNSSSASNNVIRDKITIVTDEPPSSSSSMLPKIEVDVVIVGAGIAGLTAALRMQQQSPGTTFLVLEASDRFGGRLKNIEIKEGYITEGGGQWIGPAHLRALALIEELGMDVFPTFCDGCWKVGTWGMSVSMHEPARDKRFEDEIAKLEALGRSIPLDRPWTAANASVWDKRSFKDWIDKECPASAREVFYNMCRSINTNASEVSFLYVLWWLHSVGGYSSIADIKGGAQQYRVVGGTQQICNGIAQRIGKENIILSSPVRRIYQPEFSGIVIVESDQACVRAKRVIFAAQPQLTQYITFSPRLSPARQDLARSLTGQQIVKIHFVYDTPFWRDAGLAGLGVYNDIVVFDNSPPDASLGVLLAFVFQSNLTEDQQVEKVRRAFRILFGVAAASPTQILIQDWSKELWQSTCVSSASLGLMTRSWSELHRPHGRVHWAGTETSHSWFGYIEGAIISGERVASEVVESLQHDAHAGDSDAPK